jgi:RNA polymerase sigma-70 factor, ECF subfamily
VYAMARRVTGNDEDARDAAQEVFIRLHGALGSVDVARRFTTWLYRLTVNLAIDHRRRRLARRTTPYDGLDEPRTADPGPLPDEQAEGRALRSEIDELAHGLANRQRTAFILRDIEDRTTAEIAAIMGCRESTVRVHLAKARDHIRAALMKRHPGRFGGHRHDSPENRS